MSSFDMGSNSSLPITAIASNSASGDVVPNLPTVFSVDDEAVATVTDNGDGTATVVRVSVAGGIVTVAATVTNTDGSVITGSLELTFGATSTTEVADTVTIVPGTPS
jgi:hypothetical protein